MLKKFAPIITALVLTACATGGGYNHVTPIDRLRSNSLNIVHILANSTRTYLQTHSEEDAVEKAMDAVKQLLKDPESARFQDVRLVDYKDGKVICGQINAKNSYGGYAGNTWFAASPYEATLEQQSERRYAAIDEAANTGLRSACRR